MWTLLQFAVAFFPILAIAVALGGCVANQAGHMSLSKELAGQGSYFVDGSQDDATWPRRSRRG